MFDGLPHGTSPMCTSSRTGSARTSCSHEPPRLTRGFNANVLAATVATLDRFRDNEIAVPDGSALWSG